MMSQHPLRIFFCFAVFSLLFGQCREYEFPAQPYPRLQGMTVTDISDAGALFRVRVTAPGEKPVTDHGFFWSLRPDPREFGAEKISLGPLGRKTSFEARIGYGLRPDTTYYARAFTRTADHTVYGQVVRFRSAGSLAPVIDEVSPGAGACGDTITLIGAHFSSLKQNVDVFFGTQPSRVLAAAESKIRCIVPDVPEDTAVHVRVVAGGQEGRWKSAFGLLGPELFSFHPREATFGDVITLRGAHFSREKVENKVFFNEFAAEVLMASDTVLEVAVPLLLNTKANTIRVAVRTRETAAESDFLLRPPVIHSVSPDTASAGDLVVIQGENFATHKEGNVVMFGNKEARVFSANATGLKVIVPSGVNVDSANIAISVIVAGQQATWQGGWHLQP